MIRILIVDDHGIVREGLQRLLDSFEDLTVVGTVQSGEEAVDAVPTLRPDVVLMDLEMPEMDGMETAQAIRELESNTEEYIPIIAMTAHAVKGYRERCIEAGMDGYLTKPIWPDELFAALSQAVAGAKAAELAETTV